MKSSLSERFNRTLQEKINRYMTANDTRKFIDVVPSLVSGYNNTIHTVTKMLWQDDFLAVKPQACQLIASPRETLNSKWATEK